jgi:hypothetical protein
MPASKPWNSACCNRLNASANISTSARDMQTVLLRGFRSNQESMTVKVAKLTADVSIIDTATDKRIAQTPN